MALSPDLLSWAELAGATYADTGEALRLCTSGGESCDFIRPAQTDATWLDVTRSSRRQGEAFLFSAASMDAVEKYFWMSFGFDIRLTQRLPRLVFPIRPEELGSGYGLRSLQPDMLELIDPEGRSIVRTFDGHSGTSLLVKLSNVLGYSPDELRASYLDPAGHPIFPRRA